MVVHPMILLVFKVYWLSSIFQVSSENHIYNILLNNRQKLSAFSIAPWSKPSNMFNLSDQVTTAYCFHIWPRVAQSAASIPDRVQKLPYSVLDGSLFYLSENWFSVMQRYNPVSNLSLFSFQMFRLASFFSSTSLDFHCSDKACYFNGVT